MGPVVPGKLTRMGFLLCEDAVPAFNAMRKGAPSLMPVELANFSFAPHLRYDPDNMTVWMLIPADMTAEAKLKFFNYIVENELNPLIKRGVPGPDGPVKVKMFGAALDLKGKEKFYNQVYTIFRSLFIHYLFTIYSLFFVHYFSFTNYSLIFMDRSPSLGIAGVVPASSGLTKALGGQYTPLQGVCCRRRTRSDRRALRFKVNVFFFTMSRHGVNRG